MFNRWLKVLIIVAICTVAGHAQETWRGLSFGMSEAQVRGVYSGTLTKADGVGNIAFRLVNSNDKLFSYPLEVTLDFDVKGKLFYVDLSLPDDLYSSDPEATPKSFATVQFIDDNLVQKYGTPSTADGCLASIPEVNSKPAESVFTCNKVWRAQGQNVTLFWSLKNRRIHLLRLTYAPLQNDL
jgi:hypothetical protein